MSMHEHADKKCEHELKHCAHCDVVFCEKCKREWRTVNVIDSRLKDFLEKKEPQTTRPPMPPWISPGPMGPIMTDTPMPTPLRILCHGGGQ